MTSSPLSCRLLIFVSAAMLTWIVMISLALKFLFGAGATGGWLIVGIMFTVVLAGLIMLAREFKESILVPSLSEPDAAKCKPAASKRLFKRRSFCMAESIPHVPHGDFSEPRRAALGLSVRQSHSNVRRSRNQKPARRDAAVLTS